MPVIPEDVLGLSEAIRAAGGRALLVGGCVRDELMDQQPKDWDLEVYGIEPAQLRELLDRFGSVNVVGEAFTVYKVRVREPGKPARSLVVDVSLPRRESKVGRGHRGFVVMGDPFMTFAEAARRRRSRSWMRARSARRPGSSSARSFSGRISPRR